MNVVNINTKLVVQQRH